MDLPPIPTRIVLAPMAGGIGSPQLVAAVGAAGGLGFLPSGYLSASRLGEDLAMVHELSVAPYGVNLFIPAGASEERQRRADQYAQLLTAYAAERGYELGTPRYSDDEYHEKVALLLDRAPAVVSFAFGVPDPGTVDAFHDAGSAVAVTVTSPSEADAATAVGADALVAQGWEAGAHRGSWLDGDEQLGLLPLLQLLLDRVDRPVIAAGGIATRRGVAAVLAAGAHAAMAGTAFMRATEAATAPVHREALLGAGSTRMTSAFTGRPARGIENEFLLRFDQDAPHAYPEAHFLTAPMRAAARRAGDAATLNLWAGQARALTREAPAADIVEALAEGAR
jgi:nitronate monooxygenase